ncbi:hypothetical protein [Phytohabitans rumicis]|uniref:Uncharacterized protein n=1 Tax=Phytohabitans rumicis TaxID=1076125 RepID=A0A6V8LEN2_9ACTN|nr:hypothetical protein [Phytohabitans rumicis]GFJ93408.1 hypothetical protein Prum_070500 [Phytohabitans rumicis]
MDNAQVVGAFFLTALGIALVLQDVDPLVIVVVILGFSMAPLLLLGIVHKRKNVEGQEKELRVGPYSWVQLSIVAVNLLCVICILTVVPRGGSDSPCDSLIRKQDVAAVVVVKKGGPPKQFECNS